MDLSRRMLLSAAVTSAALPAGWLVAEPSLAAGSGLAGRSFGRRIDPYAAFEPARTCSPTPKPGVRDFRNRVLAAYPGTGNLGITRSCAGRGRSEHEEGRAWDWAVSARSRRQAAQAEDLLDWLLATDRHGNRHAMARRLGIMYVIWDGEVWGAYRAWAGWRPYRGSNRHTTHMHISFSWAGAMQRTSWWRAR